MSTSGLRGSSRTATVVGARGFPPALTSFVGRVHEVDRLAQLLSKHRLVTIVGPGGVGKTRLAAEVTQRVSDDFDGRARVVELASMSSPDQVAQAIATRLGARQQSGRSWARAAADVLSVAPSLLVLDNCEHVIEPVAEFCDEVLACCDDLVILATSREQIGVVGEVRMRLGPLATGTPGRRGTDEATGVALFVDRVRMTDPSFVPSTESAELASRIVTRLDGLPLAIELAAARVESLGMTELFERLAEPFGVLSHGTRTAPVRHRSLRATVDWSYQLMSSTQQRVFRRLAVFPGSFTLAQAEAVAGSAAEASVVLLVDCSLLTPPRPGPDGRQRYSMLETVRAFALEQLDESGERAGAESAMVELAVGIASQAAASMRIPGGEPRAVRNLDADDALMSAAMNLALERDKVAALRLAVGLSPWWQLRGRALTGVPLLEQSLRGYPARDDVWRAAEKWLARLLHSTAAYSLALGHFTTLRESMPPDARSPDLVDALAGQSGSLRNLGSLTDARDVAGIALRIARQLDYAEGEALALAQLSLAANYADDTEAAARWALDAARIDQACLPDKVTRRVQLILAVVLTDSEHAQLARETCARGLASARAAGDVTMQADFLYFTTHIALRNGDIVDAGAHLIESLQLTAQSGDWIRVLDCLDDCAQLCAATGRPDEAITLWAARDACASRLRTPSLAQDIRFRSEPLRRASRRIGPRAARAAQDRGAMMSLTTAAEFAAMLAGAGSPDTPEPSGGIRLTPRERELLVLVAQGRTDAEIADELFISIRTVRSHLDRIRDKTGSRRRADLTMLALRTGLI